MRPSAVVLSVASIVACAGPASTPPGETAATAAASAMGGQQAQRLGVARADLATLPAGNIEVHYSRVESAAAHTHDPVFVFVDRGFVTLEVAGATVRAAADEALFVAGGTPHTYREVAGDVYEVGLRPVGAATAGMRSAWASGAIERSAFGPGKHELAIVLLDYGPGMATSVHQHAGIEPGFVLSGPFEIRTALAPLHTLQTGQGEMIMPNVPLVARNPGPARARMLVLVLTPDGKPFSEPAALP